MQILKQCKSRIKSLMIDSVWGYFLVNCSLFEKVLMQSHVMEFKFMHIFNFCEIRIFIWYIYLKILGLHDLVKDMYIHKQESKAVSGQ